VASPRLLLLLACLLAQGGCARTSGSDWLREPLPPQAPVLDASFAEPVRDAPSATRPEGVRRQTSARPRLQHTVTLGESYSSPASQSASNSTAASPVQVTVQTYVPVSVTSYGSPGYVMDGDAPPPAGRGSGLQPGQDFPHPPSYGPAFPYRSGPAPAWER
jgi:hypothetical protein